MTNDSIQKKTQDLLSKFSEGRFPVPVIEIAKHLGVNVYSETDYPANKDGHIEMDGQGEVSIIVNGSKPPVRKRFTIAHEIAHFTYDKDYLKEHGTIDRNGVASDATYREREKRANNFAAQLLMPEEQFIEQWIALGEIEKVADYFGVSQDAVKYRAINIGLSTI